MAPIVMAARRNIDAASFLTATTSTALTTPNHFCYTIPTTSLMGSVFGKESSTEERAELSSSFSADVALRLQQLVAGWRGAERGQPLSALHDECLNAVGPGGRHLLPAYLLPVRNLDETNLRTAIQRANGRLRGTSVRFRFRVSGRFDAALVPFGPTGTTPDRWLFAFEENLSVREQVALYGHALGHLLLNREQVQLGQLPPLDPRDGHAHRDTLAELRLDEAVRQLVDRRVLETYPLLAELLRGREEPPITLDTATNDLRQQLAHAGWRGPFLNSPYVFTNGRVYIRGTVPQHGRKLRVDALLRAAASLPIAVVQTIHAGQTREAVIQRLKEYAHFRLTVPFAYLLEEDGTMLEFDWTTGEEPKRAVRSTVPTRDELLNRWLASLELSDATARNALTQPYRLGAMPRYYQEAAINRAIIATLQAKRQKRSPRILLTLATGTGKTKVAFQLLWKLKRSSAIRNVLFITDRDYLLSQAMDNEFAPFGDARTRILGEAKTSRDVVFATYQAIADTGERLGLYRSYPRNFFDVVIIDECHRGSAQEDSRWRTILEHFDTAIQIGLTATPLKNDMVQTDDYFGEPIYTYSLRTGINDGFLAPYRVRYVLMGSKQEEEQSQETHEVQKAPPTPVASSTPSSTSTQDDGFDADASMNGQEINEETAATLIARTSLIAQHLATYLRQSDPLAKTIVFCVDQAHAESMRVALEQACSEYVMRYTGYIERIVSEEGTEGKRALGRFSTPEERTPVIVTTSRLLSTGVDVPTCKNIVLARPVRSMVEFKQIIGRGSRLHEPDKTWFTIIDYAGAIRLFFDASFDGDPELVEVEPLLPQLQQANDGATNAPSESQAGMEEGLTAPPLPTGSIPPVQEQVIVEEEGSSTAIENVIVSEDTPLATASVPPLTASHPPVKNAVKEVGTAYPSDQEKEQASRSDTSLISSVEN